MNNNMSEDLINLESQNKIQSTENLYNGKYKKINKLGFGAFGTVFKVLNLEDNQYYAMKKFYMDNQKLGKGDIVKNQFELLKSLKHQNIIEVVEYFVHKENECIIFPFYEKDLLKIINNKKLIYDEEFIKSVLKQILEGINYLHEKEIIHRDLKPENILVTEEGILKITDFDLTRLISYDHPMSKGAVTIYYRPPEIFYGDVQYNLSVDMWSFGCILAEFILREPIFKGRNEIDVIFKIHEVLGSPNEEIWPECSKLQNFISFGNDNAIRPLDEILYGKISQTGLDLIKSLLVYNPFKRLSAQDTLNHLFFDAIEINSEIIKNQINSVN